MFDKLVIKQKKKFRGWVGERYFNLALLNVFLLFLVLLKSAGYFDPFFPLTINLIVVAGMIATIILLRVRSSFTFGLSFIFWILAGAFRILGIIPWAERSAIYSYEALAIALIQFILEIVFKF